MSKMSDVARKTLGGGGVTGGLEKIKLVKLIETYPDGVAVTGFDIISANGGTFPSFTFMENPNQCFSGGKALQELVDAWIECCDGDITEANASLAAEPVILKLEKTKTKAGRDYTKVTVLGTRKIEKLAKQAAKPAETQDIDDDEAVEYEVEPVDMDNYAAPF